MYTTSNLNNKNVALFNILKQKCFDSNSEDKENYKEYLFQIETKLKSFYYDDLEDSNNNEKNSKSESSNKINNGESCKSLKVNEPDFFEEILIKLNLIENLSILASKELTGIIIHEFLTDLDTPKEDRGFTFDPQNNKVISCIKEVSYLIEKNSDALLDHINLFEEKIKDANGEECWQECLNRLVFIIKFIYDINQDSNKSSELYLLVNKISKSNYTLNCQDNSSLAFIENSVNRSFKINYKNRQLRLETKNDYENLGNVFNVPSLAKTMKLNKVYGEKKLFNCEFKQEFLNIEQFKTQIISNNESQNVISNVNTMQTNATEGLNNNEYINILPIYNEGKENNRLSKVNTRDSKDLKVILEENSNLNDIESIKKEKKNSSKNFNNLNLNSRLSSKIANKKVSINAEECNEDNEDMRKSNIISVRRLTEISHTEPKPKNFVIATNNQQHPHIVIPPNFSTDDEDLKNLLELMLEDNGDKQKWEKMVDDKKITCFRRSVEGSTSMVVKAIATIDGFTKEEVFEAIYDLKLRMSWDHVFSDFKVVRQETDNSPEILYMSIKAPSVFIKDRDFLQQRKSWKKSLDDKTYIIHFKSVELPEVPEYSKFVRAHTYISGYYIREISTNPVVTRLVIITRNDIKGLIPKFIVNSASAKAPKQWVENLKSGCAKIRKSNLLNTKK